MPVLKKYNRNFFKVWCPEMAYVLGFFCADGNMVRTKRGTHFISLYSADEQLLLAIRDALSSEHLVAKRSGNSGDVYRLQIGSAEWFFDLESLGLMPGKSKRMRMPAVPPRYLGDFIRGYFDGDGNVWSGSLHKNRKTPTPTLQVSFTSASHEFLADVRLHLQKIGVRGGGLRRSKTDTFSRLIFGKEDALTIYKIVYNSRHKLFLKRKKDVFDKFVANNCGGSSTG